MGSLNKVQLIGNVGQDPEIRYTADNKPIANLSLATTDRWKKDGQQQEKTEWHRVVVFGGLAEVIEKYVGKGDKIYIEGKLQTRKWTDNNGQEKYSTEIIVDQFGGSMQMLGNRGGDESAVPRQQQRTSAPAQPVQEDAPFDDDIPF